MRKFTLEIACDNAAFEENPAREVGRILRELDAKLRREGLDYHSSDDGKVRDVNGNTVGGWRYDSEA